MLKAFEAHRDCKAGVLPLLYTNLSRGTSFCIGASGLALSSWHNVESEAVTTSEGQPVKVVAFDRNLDVALLQYPPKVKYTFLPLGDSQCVPVGSRVYHYGFGMDALMGFHGLFQGCIGNKVYSTAHMMHGQSGGPLVSEAGRVIGINKGHFYCSQEKIEQTPYHTGPSMYIPINNVKEFLGTHASLTAEGWKVK